MRFKRSWIHRWERFFPEYRDLPGFDSIVEIMLLGLGPNISQQLHVLMEISCSFGYPKPLLITEAGNSLATLTTPAVDRKLFRRPSGASWNGGPTHPH